MNRLLMTAAAAAFALGAMSAQAAENVTYLFPAPDFLPAFAPLQLAKSKGYFEEAGLDVTFRIGKGGADVATQVAAGNADLGGAIGDTPIIVRPNGLDVRGVALLGGHGLTQLAWRTDTGITGPADLEGKTVGVISYQASTYYALRGALASEGLDENDVSIQSVGAGGLIQLMAAGRLDAIADSPDATVGVQEAGIEIDQVPVDTLFPSMAQAIIASGETIAERPEMIRAFVAAVLRAVEDISADPAAAAQEFAAVVPQYQDREDEVRKILEDYATLVYPPAEGHPLGTFDPARMKAVQDFYLEAGIVQSAVPVEDLYTNEFVQ